MKKHSYQLVVSIMLACALTHFSPGASAQAVKLAMGGAPPPPPGLIDLGALDVEYVEFQHGWNNVAGNAVDPQGNPVFPTMLSPTWIRKQFNLPARAGAKTLVWDIEGARIAGLHAGIGAAYQKDLEWIVNVPEATRNAIPGMKVWMFNPYGWRMTDPKTPRGKDLARIAAGTALNQIVDGSGMCAYSTYEGAARNGRFDEWWKAQGATFLEWVRSGCEAYRTAHSFCAPEPETVVYIASLNIGDPALSIVPDDVLIAMIKAAIQGGANRICLWNAWAHFRGRAWEHPEAIAETRRAIRCMRIAAGYEQLPAPPPPVEPRPAPAPAKSDYSGSGQASSQLNKNEAAPIAGPNANGSVHAPDSRATGSPRNAARKASALILACLTVPLVLLLVLPRFRTCLSPAAWKAGR